MSTNTFRRLGIKFCALAALGLGPTLTGLAYTHTYEHYSPSTPDSTAGFGTVIIYSSYTAVSGGEVIEGIQFGWSDGFHNGSLPESSIYLLVDPNNDGNFEDVEVVASTTYQLEIASFNTSHLTDIYFDAPYSLTAGTVFLVGISLDTSQGIFPHSDMSSAGNALYGELTPGAPIHPISQLGSWEIRALASASAIPEPASSAAVLGSLALGGLVARRRR